MTDSKSIDVAAVASRIESLYNCRKALDENCKGKSKVLKVRELDLNQVFKSKLDRALEDPRDAINYMVWIIGETLNACGGMPLLRRVEEAFYEGHDDEFEMRASFLNARWDGVGDWYA